MEKHQDIEWEASSYVQEIAVSKILANRYQPRTLFEEEELNELAESIKIHGILQPIILRQVTKDMYEIVAGERRYRAAKSLGLPTVSAIVKEIDSNQAAVLALIENIQREDLSAIEEAKSYANMLLLLNKTQQELAEMVGKSQSSVANKLRLLTLTEEAQHAIEQKLITERHGRALLRIKDELEQKKVLEYALVQKFTVSDLEKYIESFLSSTESPQGNRIFAVAKDTKLALNTVNQAIKAIRNFGMTIEVEQEEVDDRYKIEITIPKNLIEQEVRGKGGHVFSSDLSQLNSMLGREAATPSEEQAKTSPIEEPLNVTQPMVLDLDLTDESKSITKNNNED